MPAAAGACLLLLQRCIFAVQILEAVNPNDFYIVLSTASNQLADLTSRMLAVGSRRLSVTLLYGFMHHVVAQCYFSVPADGVGRVSVADVRGVEQRRTLLRG